MCMCMYLSGVLRTRVCLERSTVVDPLAALAARRTLICVVTGMHHVQLRARAESDQAFNGTVCIAVDEGGQLDMNLPYDLHMISI